MLFTGFHLDLCLAFLQVHKLVLLAMSPYLQETFKNADPRSQLEVNLPSDTTYETAKAFLKYIYEGVLEVSFSDRLLFPYLLVSFYLYHCLSIHLAVL